MNQNNLIKERIAEIQSQLPAEKAWWDNRRAAIESDFMEELKSDGNGKVVEPAQRKTGSDDDAVIVEAGGPAGAQGTKKKKKKQQQQQQQQEAVV
jgi:translocation protein SEC66